MITEALTVLAAGAKIIETQVERAKQNETLDLGALNQTAADLRALHNKLEMFKHASEAIDTDDDFAKLVRTTFTRSKDS
jgi:hypothetical protein